MHFSSNLNLLTPWSHSMYLKVSKNINFRSESFQEVLSPRPPFRTWKYKGSSKSIKEKYSEPVFQFSNGTALWAAPFLLMDCLSVCLSVCVKTILSPVIGRCSLKAALSLVDVIYLLWWLFYFRIISCSLITGGCCTKGMPFSPQVDKVLPAFRQCSPRK